jgi:hypothetical protein
MRHQDARPGALRQGRRTSIEGGGARPLGGLEHQAGAAAGHPEPTDRGLGAVPDTQPGPTSAFAKPSIPSCPYRPSSRTSSWRNRRPASGYRQTRTRSGSLKSLDDVRIDWEKANGRGTTRAGHLFLGSGRPIWNNDGDTATLIDPHSIAASRYRY